MRGLQVQYSLAGLANPEPLIENHGVQFEIIGEIEHVETIAAGAGVLVRALLNKVHGKGRWRKRKGFARVRLPSGTVRRVELHWYEAHGIGRRDFKIKAYADQP
jgi:hypothetical protein